MIIASHLLAILLSGTAGPAEFEYISNIPPTRYGAQCNRECVVRSQSAAIGGDLIVFESQANNLLPFDQNGQLDVFVRRRSTGETNLVSGTNSQPPIDGYSRFPALSANGRYVSFASSSALLVPTDTNARDDIFVKDLLTGQLEIVSNDHLGNPGNDDVWGHSSISDDGMRVAFHTEANLTEIGSPNLDVFVRDRITGFLELASLGPNGAPAQVGVSLDRISGDGRYVTMLADGTNWLPPGDPARGRLLLYLRDLESDTTRMLVDGVDRNLGYWGSPAIANGKVLLALGPEATQPFQRADICGIALYDLQTSTFTPRPVQVTPSSSDWCLPEDLSDDGAQVLIRTTASLLPSDTNTGTDVYTIDVDDGEITLVSRRPDGSAHTAGIASFVPQSHDVVYNALSRTVVSGDTNEVIDGFLVAPSGVAERVTIGGAEHYPGAVMNNSAAGPFAIDHDANRVLFEVWANWFFLNDTAPDGPRLVLGDRQSGDHQFVSILPDGTMANFSRTAALSGDGRIVAFNAWVNDGGGQYLRQLVLRSMDTASSVFLSQDANGQLGNGSTSAVALSHDGRFVAFRTSASNLVDPPMSGVILADSDAGTFTHVAGRNRSLDYSETLSISSDGERLVFTTDQQLLGEIDSEPDVYIYFRSTGLIQLVSESGPYIWGHISGHSATLSPDGQFVVYRTNARYSLEEQSVTWKWVAKDLDTGEIHLLNLFLVGYPSLSIPFDAPAVSRGAEVIAFQQSVTPGSGSEVLHYNRATDTAQLVGLPPSGLLTGMNANPLIGADGHVVVFQSGVDRLSPEDRNRGYGDIVARADPLRPLFANGFE